MKRKKLKKSKRERNQSKRFPIPNPRVQKKLRMIKTREETTNAGPEREDHLQSQSKSLRNQETQAPVPRMSKNLKDSSMKKSLKW